MFILVQHSCLGLIFTCFSSFLNLCKDFSHLSGLQATPLVFSADISETVTAEMQKFAVNMLLLQ
jgi:hypothetical protein